MRHAQNLIKALQATAKFDGNRTAAEQAERNPEAASMVKSLGTSTGNITGDLKLAYREVLALAQRRSLVGKIDAVAPFRTIPFEVPALEQTTGATVGFIGEGVPIPADDLDFTTRKLARRKLSGIVPVTREMAKATPAEAALSRELIRAVALGESEAFFNADAADTNGPAGVLHGVAPSSGSTDPVADVAALIDAFTGDLEGAVILTSARNGVKLAAHFDGTGARGGELAGVGHATSIAIADDQIAIVEPGRIFLSDDGLELDYSTQATIATLDSNGDPDTAVSLWQENLAAYRITRWLNWHAAAGSVAWLNNVNW